MFAETDTRWAPWTAIDGNDKKAARIAALTRVAEALAEAAFPRARRKSGARSWSEIARTRDSG